MNGTSFKLAKSGRLAPPNLYPSAEEAIAAGKQAWPGETFQLNEVRPANLSDFIVPANVVGDIREQMAEKLAQGETPLDEAIADQIFDAEDFGAELKVFADAYAEAKGFNLEGVTILVRSRDVQPE